MALRKTNQLLPIQPTSYFVAEEFFTPNKFVGKSIIPMFSGLCGVVVILTCAVIYQEYFVWDLLLYGNVIKYSVNGGFRCFHLITRYGLE